MLCLLICLFFQTTLWIFDVSLPNLKGMSLKLPLPHKEKQYVPKYSTRQLLLFLSLVMGMKFCLLLMEEKA